VNRLTLQDPTVHTRCHSHHIQEKKAGQGLISGFTVGETEALGIMCLWSLFEWFIQAGTFQSSLARRIPRSCLSTEL
jgi:hypothetical protein